jgi:hypothetical protein
MDCEPGSSVCIVSGYGLDDREIEVRCTVEVKGFFLLLLCSDQLWGLPSLLYNGYWGSFPRGKAPLGRDADQSPHLVPRSRMSRSYTPLHLSAFVACSGKYFIRMDCKECMSPHRKFQNSLTSHCRKTQSDWIRVDK